MYNSYLFIFFCSLFTVRYYLFNNIMALLLLVACAKKVANLQVARNVCDTLQAQFNRNLIEQRTHNSIMVYTNNPAVKWHNIIILLIDISEQVCKYSRNAAVNKRKITRRAITRIHTYSKANYGNLRSWAGADKWAVTLSQRNNGKMVE